MLNDLIEKMEEMIAVAMCNNRDSEKVSVSDLRTLSEAAKLLAEVHEMADSGELDGVDLEWMVKVDSMVLGVGKESA